MPGRNAVGRAATGIAAPAKADFETPTTEYLIDACNHIGTPAGDQDVHLGAGIAIGGTTGHCHQTTAAIDQAAEWLASTSQLDRPHPIIPHLQRTFGLTAMEAVQAIRDARLLDAPGA